MLEGLFVQLKTTVPLVPPVFSQKTKTEINPKNKVILSTMERRKLLDYFAAIGETDQATIDEVFDNIKNGVGNLAWILSRADEILRDQKERMKRFK